MARAKQPVSVNGIEFDALISQTDTLEATVPEYTVEDGFVVSDAIILNPEKLDMVLYITDTPVTWYSRHGSGQDRVETIVKQLQELYFTAEPTTVVTSAKSYTNMAIESLSIAKSVEIGYAREVSISFKKIRVTTAKTTTIPDSYGKSGATAGIRRHGQHLDRELRRQFRLRLRLRVGGGSSGSSGAAAAQAEEASRASCTARQTPSD